MAVFPVSDQSVTLEIGDEWLLSVQVADDDGYGIAATVVASVTKPDGTSTAPTATADDTCVGLYTARYTIAATGRHLATVTVSGTAVGVVPFTAWAQAGVAASGMPTLADVRTYLGDTSVSTGEIQNALDAEAAAQRARCSVPPVYSADLAEALKRRVARNLAARAVPVASFSSFEGGGTITRVPMLDAEIVRLEAPYRRRRVG
jgi:hypothetical protein